MSTMSVTPDPGYLAMPDAVNVNLLPAGYPAYLGYSDGKFATEAALRGLFPDSEIVILTVLGNAGAHGIRVWPGTDVEPGDMPASVAAGWVLEELKAAPEARPVIYASVVGEPGYGMPDVAKELTAARIPRASVRLLSAHYGLGPHICGPATCKAIAWEMDGTQWTDSYSVGGQGIVDMSLLRPDFFRTPPNPPKETETERIVRELGIVRQGDTGEAVRTVQGLCNARVPFAPSLKIDGIFGPATFNWVISLQHGAHLKMDGVVGPLTWPVLLGVA